MVRLALVSLLTFSLVASPAARAASPRGVPLIVLDPGHGGSNHGARGPSIGRFEKELTLILAKRTRQAILRLMPRWRVRLTRRRDTYLTLAKRRALANAWGAAVFVSIHLNATRSRSRSGFETYVLSASASDKEANRLAQAENRGRHGFPTTTSGEDPQGVKSGEVAAILADLTQRATHARSIVLAKALQSSLARARPKAKNLGVRQAPFDVLLGLRMPGALVEVGFIDHILEGKLMNDPRVQGDIAEALAQGIVSFLRQRRAHPTP